MSDNPRWERDSPAEAWEVLKALDTDQQAAQQRAERLRPAREFFTAGGLEERWPGAASSHMIKLPGWWFEIPRPDIACPLCQRPMSKVDPRRVRAIRPGIRVCGECAAQQQQPDDLLDDWLALTVESRRTRLTLHYGVDPWTWRRVALVLDELTVKADPMGRPEQILDASSQRLDRIRGGVPRTFWDGWRERGLPGSRGLT